MKPEQLAQAWEQLARAARQVADETWAKLANGELPQHDGIVLEIHTLSERARVLLECAGQLRAIITQGDNTYASPDAGNAPHAGHRGPDPRGD